jgi:hypothetical protein
MRSSSAFPDGRTRATSPAVIEQDTNSIGVVHMDDGSEPHLLREEPGKELLSGSTSGEERHDLQTKRPGEILQ